MVCLCENVGDSDVYAFLGQRSKAVSFKGTFFFVDTFFIPVFLKLTCVFFSQLNLVYMKMCNELSRPSPLFLQWSTYSTVD